MEIQGWKNVLIFAGLGTVVCAGITWFAQTRLVFLQKEADELAKKSKALSGEIKPPVFKKKEVPNTITEEEKTGSESREQKQLRLEESIQSNLDLYAVNGKVPRSLQVYFGTGVTTYNIDNPKYRNSIKEGDGISFNMGNLIIINNNPFFGTNSDFVVKIKNNKLFVSQTMRSLDGNIVCKLVDNEWQINGNNYFSRNYDDSAFEVCDKEGIIKFRIELRGEYKIKISGVFFNNGMFTFIDDVGLTYIYDENITKEKLRELSDAIPNLFKYPADLHFGERNN